MIAAFSPALDAAAFLATLALGGLAAACLLALAAACWPDQAHRLVDRAHRLVDRLADLAADPGSSRPSDPTSAAAWPYDQDETPPRPPAAA